MWPPQSTVLILVLAIALTLVRPSHAFSRFDCARPRGGVAIISPGRRTPTLGVEAERGEATSSAADGHPSSTMTVDFVGKSSFASEPAPSIVGGGRSLRDFFDLPRSPRLLLRGSKGNPITELGGGDVDSELLGRYERMCSAVGASPPTSEDRFFEVITTGVKFPGLRVMSAATMGVKVAVDAADFPRYEVVLIRDSTYAEGNRLFKWFFDKVTGKDKDGKDGSGDQTTRSLNMVRANPVGEGAISFECVASLAVQVKFPSFLMKVLPGMSREKMEKAGGESLCKVLEADIPVSLELFRKEYVDWLDS